MCILESRLKELTGLWNCQVISLALSSRVMPHAAEPERMKKNLAAMREVKAKTLSEYLGKPAKAKDKVGFPAFNSDFGIYETSFLEVMQFVWFNPYYL